MVNDSPGPSGDRAVTEITTQCLKLSSKELFGSSAWLGKEDRGRKEWRERGGGGGGGSTFTVGTLVTDEAYAVQAGG